FEGDAAGRRPGETADRVDGLERKNAGRHAIEPEASVGERGRLETRLDEARSAQDHARRRNAADAVRVDHRTCDGAARRLEDGDVNRLAFELQRAVRAAS